MTATVCQGESIEVIPGHNVSISRLDRKIVLSNVQGISEKRVVASLLPMPHLQKVFTSVRINMVNNFKK